MPSIRRPVVASQFYEGDAEALRAQLTSCFLHKLGPQKLPTVNKTTCPREIVGLICPHAGYMYSGPVAATAFYHLAQDGKPDTVVLLGPNHTGYGSALSIMREGAWQTPLGKVEIDTALADDILHETKYLDIDELAHRFEHSLEVQLPFLQFLYGDSFKIVPICYQMQDYDSAVEIGRALTEALDAANTVVIASSDMTHYESAKSAAAKDHAALKAVTALDAKAFFDVVEAENITACGYAPITSLITYAVGVCAKAELLSYHNSGDITGDPSSVVGYAAVSFKKIV
ncbi:MAG: AmmeMemoRadiSam system protein B [Candidatus Bathyarchaeota archaeon]|nr:AmmeMemoRadiSam system protein B [Candidatus Bathyarchaeota archaeon]